MQAKLLKEQIRKFRRNIFEFFGSDYYSRSAAEKLDDKLAPYLANGNFFIEAGAHDGFSQSNTYYLERFKGWKGILIEPIPELYQKCVKQRPNSKVFNYALVPADYTGEYVEINYGNLMSMVKGALADPEAEAEHLAKAKKYYGIETYQLKVPARTLTSILDELKVKKIDFLSLDVEGFEISALKGLDFEKYRPQYMLIECLDEKAKEELEAYISNFYDFTAKLSRVNYLYQSK